MITIRWLAATKVDFSYSRLQLYYLKLAGLAEQSQKIRTKAAALESESSDSLSMVNRFYIESVDGERLQWT